MNERKKTRTVRIGSVAIGGGNPVIVQSMTCTKTEDIRATVEQILMLEEAGCEIIRVAVPGEEAADAIPEIKKQIHIPIVADIHFDYNLAVRSIRNGADKIRINPGNIGSADRLRSIYQTAGEFGIPVRIGVNSGSVEKDLLDKYGAVCAEALVESAMRHIEISQDLGFDNLVISVKASHVPLMIRTNRLLSEKTDFPLHLGVTEAGTVQQGVIRSAIGIGTLLAEGIGDTIRVSLTGDPVHEIRAAFDILRALEMRKQGVTLISCPTCGRTEVNVEDIANQVERALTHIKKPLTVAVMGCAVNGPGEAKAADIGVACGKGSALLFRHGEIVEKIQENEIVARLVKEIEQWDND
ncbi:flavodoxin-dependent (E)-4-hydroxy-3-methylbut-2-enyl-diphosphate synthase [bacterium]|nr:flavodoxin-dependent (E)-4-hydroxy-3-methylbut-2-enyl-diphosphate synthase [bacterium]